jgi:hypothetical protein
MQMPPQRYLLSFRPGAPVQFVLSTTNANVTQREIVQPLVAAPVFVVVDEIGQLGLQVARWVTVLSQHLVLSRAMVTRNPALDHRMVGLAAGTPHPMTLKPADQGGGNLAAALVR